MDLAARSLKGTVAYTNKPLKNQNHSATTKPGNSDKSSQSLRCHTSKPTPGKGSGLKGTEKETLVNFLEQIQMFCRDKWNLVKAKQNREFTINGRTVDILRRKFASINRKRMPTGDQMMPDDVRRVEKLCQKTEGSKIACGDENVDEVSWILNN